MSKNFEYGGTDNLQIMECAVNYNAFLKNLILRSLHTPPPEIQILDIGAGIGTFAEILKKVNLNVTCIEPDKNQFNIVQKKGFKVFASIDEIPDNSIDFIYSLNVLEHIENDKEIFGLWIKKLKIGGKILIYVPAFNCIWSALDTKVEHYRRYTKKTLENVFISSNIKIQKSEYVDCLGFFAALVYKILNKDGNLEKRTLVFYDKIVFPTSRFFDCLFRFILGKNVFVVGEK